MSDYYPQSISMVVPVSGTTASGVIGAGLHLCLDIPALDTTTLTINGSLDGVTFRPIYGKDGAQVLDFASGTGNIILGAEALEELEGIPYLQVVCGNPQNSGARTFTLFSKSFISR